MRTPLVKISSVVVTVSSETAPFDQACTVAQQVTLSSDDVIDLGRHIGHFQKSISTAFEFTLNGISFRLIHE